MTSYELFNHAILVSSTPLLVDGNKFYHSDRSILCLQMRDVCWLRCKSFQGLSINDVINPGFLSSWPYPFLVNTVVPRKSIQIQYFSPVTLPLRVMFSIDDPWSHDDPFVVVMMYIFTLCPVRYHNLWNSFKCSYNFKIFGILARFLDW